MTTPVNLLPLLNSDNQGKPGELPAFAWPGSYAMFYVTNDGCELCAKCATSELLDWLGDDDFSYDPPVAAGAYGVTNDYPDYTERCDNCNAVICAQSE